MNTSGHLPYPSRILRVVLVCLAAFFQLHSQANAMTTVEPSHRNVLANQQFFCSAGYGRACEQHAAQLRAVLTHYPASQLGPWNWVIVRSEDWQPLLLRLHLDQRSPAFTALEQRSTFLEEVLFLPTPKRTEALERDYQTPLAELLPVAVSHELAHAICHETDESAANRIAEELRRGRPAQCGRARGLSAVQELDLHRTSPGFRP